jgi:hypothetical protein
MGDDLFTQASLCDIELTSAKICDDFRDCAEVLDSVAVLFRENYPMDLRSLQSALAAHDSDKIAFLFRRPTALLNR